LVAAAQTIVDSSCLIFDASSASADGSDMSHFLAAAWAMYPDLIPNEVGCVVPEPVEPFIEGQLPLFLHASELIHSKCDTLGFRALVKILEIHDFSPLEDSSDDNDTPGSSDSSGGDDLPGSGIPSSLRPWPAIFHFVGGSSPGGQPWPSLPRHDGDVQWGLHATGVLHASRPESGERA
jgi:hypothetical protein